MVGAHDFGRALKEQGLVLVFGAVGQAHVIGPAGNIFHGRQAVNQQRLVTHRKLGMEQEGVGLLTLDAHGRQVLGVDVGEAGGRLLAQQAFGRRRHFNGADGHPDTARRGRRNGQIDGRVAGETGPGEIAEFLLQKPVRRIRVDAEFESQLALGLVVADQVLQQTAVFLAAAVLAQVLDRRKDIADQLLGPVGKFPSVWMGLVIASFEASKGLTMAFSKPFI